MKIGIVGWGIETQSAYRYFGPEHEYLIVNEHPRDDFPPQSDKVKVQFVAEEKAEMDYGGRETALHMAAVKNKADIFLENNGNDIEAFKDTAEKALKDRGIGL